MTDFTAPDAIWPIRIVHPDGVERLELLELYETQTPGPMRLGKPKILSITWPASFTQPGPALTVDNHNIPPVRVSWTECGPRDDTETEKGQG
jgi:hypothetical protein